MKFHLLFLLKTLFPLLFILFLSQEVKAQNAERTTGQEEQYVRPVQTKDTHTSDSTQKVIKKLKKQKKKAERQARKLNKLKTKPGDNLSKATTTIDQKTDQLIETTLPQDTTRNQNKIKKELKRTRKNLVIQQKKRRANNLRKRKMK